ncbi:MAG: ABC transporter ATP-binding protein [Peptococcaceae bacterium]|nr:ABC transporter ATP-binding protein [Peptococcaceae bacterium]
MNLSILVQHVTKRFGRTFALRDFSLAVPHGIVMGILGPNGSGKSTLMRILAGVQRPDWGRVEVLGQTPGACTKARVAFVPEIDHLYRWMDVREALDFTASFWDDFDYARAEELLAFTGLKRENRIADLSKGLKARLKLVIAMSRKADVVLLDEPLSGIDPVSRERVLQGIVQGYRPGEATVLITTHLVREVEPLLDRVAFMRDGELVLEGEVETLRRERGRSLEQIYREVLA